MPSYDYRCSQCGVFEAFQSITAEPLSACPTCGAQVKRLISVNNNIVFKGSGFYTTDHRKTDYKNRSKEEAPATSSGDSKAS